jgi:uncharacterized protein (DUF1800 family)
MLDRLNEPAPQMMPRFVATAFLVLGLASPAAAAPRPLTPSEYDLLNRVTWGANASSARQLAALGPERWLSYQLQPDPNAPLPPAAQAQIDGFAISRTPLEQLVALMDAQGKAANQLTDPDQKKLAQSVYQQAIAGLAHEAAAREILRDIYSPKQLQEQMTWFWVNHFNVLAAKANLRELIGDYEETAIRPHALGRFRDLLEATVRHPAMLRYLDNADNAVGHINENYAREIMELHTMGVGSGYSQKDVQELARILTGVGIDTNPDPPKLNPGHAGDLVRDGLFEFNPNRHDYGDKLFLGHAIKGAGYAEVRQALDLLARHPATATHISRQLATYFVADDPPEALVARMAQAYRKSDGDIETVLGVMFRSPQFKASLGAEFKDPLHFTISAVRLAYDDRVILNAGPVQGWVGRLDEGLYAHETPDGYPMNEAAWDGPGQMSLRFEIARQLGSSYAGLFKPDAPGASEQPGFPTLQNALNVDGFGEALGPNTRSALAAALSPKEWNALYLSSPEFMRR